MRSTVKYIIILAASTLFAACHRPEYSSRDTSKVVKKITDSDMSAMLKPYKEQMTTQLQQVVGYTDSTLTKGQPESTLGNLVADAQLTAARAIDNSVEAAVANIGGLRTNSVNKGNITLQNMYELMPFDNMLTIVDIPDTTLQIFCDHMAAYNGWPVSGISYVIADKKAVAIRINGKPLQPKKIYKIAVNDYLAGGGDYCSFLQPLPQKPTGVFIRDAIINYTKSNNPLHITIGKRITYDK